jgi:pentose-5-phosphate-3-epimerase
MIRLTEPAPINYGKKIELATASKETIIKQIDKYGCDMLQGKVENDTTKKEIVKHLKQCNCPVLKGKFK